jgi:Matrixin
LTSFPSLEGWTWKKDTKQIPASEASKALLPFGIKPSPVGGVQPDGTHLVRYAFTETPYSTNFGDATPPTKRQKKAMVEAMKQASEVANLRFEPVSEKDNPDLTISGAIFKDPKENDFANRNFNNASFSPYLRTIFFSNLAEDYRFNLYRENANNKGLTAEVSVQFSDIMTSEALLSTSLHELGHAVGLNHPRRYQGEENEKNRCEISKAADQLNNEEPKTVMSYEKNRFAAQRYGDFDIAALQAIHGKPKKEQAVENKFDLGATSTLPHKVNKEERSR